MKLRNTKAFKWIISLLMMFSLFASSFLGCSLEFLDDSYNNNETVQNESNEVQDLEQSQIVEDGTYTSKDEVAEYINTFSRLPDNYITKNEAKDLGWESNKGNLWDVAPGKSIGGDKFGNREGLLPKASGRQWYECDIDYNGGYRGEKRILYSNDGLIYYTEDHYSSFEQLY